MESMDDDTVADALRGAGVALMKGSTSDSQREALKAHLGGCKLSVRETFDRIDEDKSGFLDEEEVEKGAAMLGASLGFLLSEDMLKRAWSTMSPDDDVVSYDVFESWWRGVEGGQVFSDVSTMETPVASDAVSQELEEAKRLIAQLVLLILVHTSPSTTDHTAAASTSLPCRRSAPGPTL